MLASIRMLGIFAASSSLLLCGCAYEVGYRGEYLPQEPPQYVAQGKLLVVMPEEQRSFVYEGPPSSRTGDFTTLTVPLGAIVQEIASHVFGECFAYGVEFAPSRAGRDDYVLAIEGDMREFVYSHTKVIDEGFNGERADVWIVTLHDLMLELAADVRPLLMEECEVTDLATTAER